MSSASNYDTDARSTRVAPSPTVEPPLARSIAPRCPSGVVSCRAAKGGNSVRPGRHLESTRAIAAILARPAQPQPHVVPARASRGRTSLGSSLSRHGKSDRRKGGRESAPSRASSSCIRRSAPRSAPADDHEPPPDSNPAAGLSPHTRRRDSATRLELDPSARGPNPIAYPTGCMTTIAGAGASGVAPPVLPSIAPSSIPMSSWESSLQSPALSSSCTPGALNALVMNFLIVAGYQHVAEEFERETGTKPSVPLSSISARTGVRDSLSSGSISSALAQIESLAPSLLASNPQLLIALKQQHLIELIRSGDIPGALSYARQHLREGCLSEADLLRQMENIMSLLAFSSLPPEQNPMKHLLDQAQRNQLGDQVNEKILEVQMTRKESQLEALVKQLQHSQQSLKQFVPDGFPEIDCAPPGTTSATTSATSGTAASSALPALLDPARTFESLAAAEAVARRQAEELAAQERAALAEQREAERQAKAARDAARRLRQAEAAAQRAREPHSIYRHDIPPASAEEEEEEEEEDDPEEEDDDEERASGEEEGEDDEDQPMM